MSDDATPHTRRRILGTTALLAVGLLATWGPTALAAPPANPPPALVAGPDAVAIGDTITVTGNFCPEGDQLDVISQWSYGFDPRSPGTYVLLDPAGAGVVQTASGFSFQVPAERTAAMSFSVRCTDGTTAESNLVEVFPIDELWFTMAPYLNSAAGAPLTVDARSLGCVASPAPTGRITDETGATLAAAPGSIVSQGTVRYVFAIPSTIVAGQHEYRTTISCTTAGGATLSASIYTAFYGGSDGGGTGVPATGARGRLIVPAALFLGLGFGLVVVAQTRRTA